jgi:hypothetical protein
VKFKAAVIRERGCHSGSSQPPAQSGSALSPIKRLFCRQTFSDLIQSNFGLRSQGKKAVQFITGIFITVGAGRDGFFPAAFPNIADVAVAEEFPFRRQASIAIDIFRFNLRLIHLRPFRCDLFPLFVIILASGNERGAFGAIESAKSNHFLHGFLLLTPLDKLHNIAVRVLDHGDADAGPVFPFRNRKFDTLRFQFGAQF